ncbi:hypothetical protein PR048_001986 [Dryococelus australis]|uniref:HAT C-terminal dimerisation domain-containing protein n=1 Tax=Dryococelus australis TaxID=614101 RepID=A0ABQ9IIW3_9NEOP|nr:hypothetical protein PR048_001986 [Dryococelus australis]
MSRMIYIARQCSVTLNLKVHYSTLPLPHLPSQKKYKFSNGSKTEVSAVDMKPRTGFGLWLAFDQIPNEPSSKINEVAHYLKEQRIPRDKILTCGGKKRARKNILNCLNVASERVFSSSGNVATAHRQSLTAQHVQELTYLHDN